MDIVDLVNDFIDNRKTEKSSVHTKSSNLNSENIAEDIEAQRANKIEQLTRRMVI
ncbi:hypothetical protein [Mesobacillus jeotgali]|uniref:hypothetical protein n=1 Tax=Mesobacillus jeotgali TaxID=129985 RepID=UPI00178384C3|nr:hypothetical protein [Mesobacillus jeotgali]UYZ24018.1 hypothetical protein FOF60_10980 [Mesobacillus jeotgali]